MPSCDRADEVLLAPLRLPVGGEELAVKRAKKMGLNVKRRPRGPRKQS